MNMFIIGRALKEKTSPDGPFKGLKTIQLLASSSNFSTDISCWASNGIRKKDGKWKLLVISPMTGNMVGIVIVVASMGNNKMIRIVSCLFAFFFLFSILQLVWITTIQTAVKRSCQSRLDEKWLHKLS